MVLFLISLMTWTPALWGLGWLVGWALDHFLKTKTRFCDWGMLSFPLLSLLGTFLNFWWPLTVYLSSGLALVGLTVFFRRVWPELLKVPRWQLALFGVFLLFESFLLGILPVHFDTGLYHLGALNWLEKYPMPLGLANLQYHYGYTSQWFVVGALLQLPGLGTTASYAANALLLFFLMVACVSSKLKGPSYCYSVLLLLLLWVPTQVVWSAFLSTLSTDFSAGVYCLFGAWLLYQVLEKPQWSETVVLFLVTLFGLTVKATVLPWALIVFSIIFFEIITQHTQKSWVRLIGVGLLIFLPWIARSLASSGCLLFPEAQTCLFPLPWSVSHRVLEFVQSAIVIWSKSDPRYFQQKTGGIFATVLQVLRWNHSSGKLLALSILGSFGWGLWTALRNRRRNLRCSRATLILFASVVVCLVFWTFRFPDPRFGFSYFFILSALLFLPILSPYEKWVQDNLGYLLFVALLMVTVRVTWQNRDQEFFAVTKPIAVGVQSRVEKTEGGIEIKVPESGFRCWDVSQPCTIFFYPKLNVENRFGRLVFLTDDELGREYVPF